MTTSPHIQASQAHTAGADQGAGQPAIAVERLRKVYGEHVAVNDLSFSVSQGEIFALLGPNGAGKTTTVEILEGYRIAAGGQVRVLGMDPRHDSERLKPRIGVMLQQDAVYPILRAREVLDLFARFFSDPENPETLLELVGLTDSATTRCRQLSGGQKRRLALALALIGKPDILFLDEPTTGMDPQARRATWDIILRVKERGTTVLLTTHFMDEAERLADRVAIIDHGSLLALDTPAGLTRSQSTTAVDVFFTTATEIDSGAVSRLPSARSLRVTGDGTYAVETGDAPTLLVELTTLLKEQGAELRDLRVGRSSLEDVFLQLTGKEMRE